LHLKLVSAAEFIMVKERLAFHRALTDLIRVYQFRDRNLLCGYGVTVTESHAVDRLVKLGSLTQNDLADALNLDKSTVSRVVNRLVKKGYARRGQHPEDGRALLLEATSRGRALCFRIERDRVALERRLLADFSPQMLRIATRAISRVARSAQGESRERL